MKIIRLSPLGAASWFMFDTMEATFAKHGHSFTENPNVADVAFFDLGTGFSQFPVEKMTAVLSHGMSLCCFDQFERTSPPPPSPKDVYAGVWDKAKAGIEWAIWMEAFLRNGDVKLSFIRRMPSKYIDFPAFCRPFDQVMYPWCDFPPTTEDELNSRPVDVCFAGTTGMWRENIVRDLRKSGLKVDLEFVSPRLEREEWFKRQRRSKLFLSGDGPGDCSDRPYQLFAIAPMLKFRNFHKLPAPWTHGIDCIEAADEFGNMREGDVEIIQGFLGNPSVLYDVYMAGIQHIKTHNTFEARSEYILKEMASVGLT